MNTANPTTSTTSPTPTSNPIDTQSLNTHSSNTQANHAQSSHTQYTDIIIVGAGPIGLSMCQALKDTGLRVHLLEKQSQEAIAHPQYDGREIAITHRTKGFMKRLEQWRELDKDRIHHLKRAEVYNGQSLFALGFDKPDRVRGRPIETLGYLLANSAIRQAAYNALLPELQHPSYLTAEFGQTIQKISNHADYAEVQLAEDRAIQGKLLLAADSRVSFVRKALGISADMQDFGRTILVFRCRHTMTNHLTAHEGFYYGKTLAVLPLGQFESSMVITIANNKVTTLKNLSNQALALELSQWLGGRLGEITITSDIFSYPLLGVHANTFYAQRSALIGDAAVGMHPVTAHGYNLGMESVEILSRLIHKAAMRGQDIGKTSLLRQYHRKHSLKTRPMYHGTNALVKLYTDDRPPAKVARHIGLRVSNILTPVKKVITAQLTG